MPFGLRNAGATYQRLVDKTFHEQIGRNLKVYVDDLVIKSRTEDEVVRDIEETFKTLRKINMKLNPKKCTFRVEEGIFLGYQVNTKGIKIWPDKKNKRNSSSTAASKEAVSAVLMTEREARQMPIYFVSRALRGPESSHRLRFSFEELNNEAEYEALIAGLRIAEKIGVQNLEVNVDSKLVANQVNGTYIAKETDMIKYLEKVKALASTFRAFSIKQVPRSKNKKADALSKMASTSFTHLSKQVLVEELKEKSVNESEVLAVVEEEGDS
ncbi:reverse transcriptase domain-containing protein [Tanacetum coccineum]